MLNSVYQISDSKTLSDPKTSDVACQTTTFLCQLCKVLPLGTNLGIVHLLWTILIGELLGSRGGLFPALAEAGFSDKQTRQAVAALREGKFCVKQLLDQQNMLVKEQNQASLLSIGGYFPVPIDWVGFYRPTLKGCQTKHFQSTAGKALPAIELGMIARPYMTPIELEGEKATKSRKFPLLVGVIRGGKTTDLLAATVPLLSKQDVLIADRQVKISHLHQENVLRFVVRGHVDMSARTEQVAPYKGVGRKSTKGSAVRPLPRRYKDKIIPASEPTRTESFSYQGRTLEAECFDNLVVEGCPLVFHAVVIRDPKYKTPWLLLTNLTDCAEIIFLLYHSRWKIEQIPQTGKQHLGGHRSFVHEGQMCHRLPELILLAASVSLYLAAITPATPTGFWDKNPQRTVGRFRRALSGSALPDFSTLPDIPDRVRNKASVFDHLPVGILAHCRQKKQEVTYTFTGN
jgi:hypothetical protein